jgi:hypothetical protein
MTNPSPRPALRKARDAEVHPAAPQPSRTTSPARPAPARAVPPPAAPPKRRRTPASVPADVITAPVRRFQGATSDTLREVDALEHIVPTTAVQPKGKRHEAKSDKPRNLMKGKAVELDVTLPKELQKAARKRAKREGLDLDTVVIDLLHAWTTRPE